MREQHSQQLRCALGISKEIDGPACATGQANITGRLSTACLAEKTDGPECVTGQADTAGRVITEIILDRKRSRQSWFVFPLH